MFSRFARKVACGLALFASLGFSAAAASQGTGTVSGTVTGIDGKPVAGAAIVLSGPARVQTMSETDGRFTIADVVPGTYAIRVSADRQTDIGTATIEVLGGKVTAFTVQLAKSNSSLATIAHVFINGHPAISTSSTPVTTINAAEYADQGYARLSDVLQSDDAITLFHTAGGGSTVLPTSAAIRGPDPTETLLDIDGHQVNNGNTGDFDVSLLDPADYSSIELVRGISPSSLVGADTIDGAINLRTIEPTFETHGLVRLTGGSFGAFGATFQQTGTLDSRLGYALSLHRQGSDGEVNENVYDVGSGTIQSVGSDALGSSALAKLRYSFGASPGYAELSIHDQSAFRDLSAGLTTFDTSGATPPPGLVLPVVDSAAGTTLQSHNAGYGLDVSVPLGPHDASGLSATTLLFRHYTSIVDESVGGPLEDSSPYLYNSRDLQDDETLQLDHRAGTGTLTVQYDVRNESLSTDFLSGVVNEESHTVSPASPAVVLEDAPANAPAMVPLAQTQRTLALRYVVDPTPFVHLTLATYYSNLSLFGSYLDPRLGIVVTPDARTAIRTSVGTTYQAPQLPELILPASLPTDVLGNFISVGNPNLKPDQATEYGLGFDRILHAGTGQTTLSADLYRVNLRQPAAPLIPANFENCGPAQIGGQATGADGTPCPLSYPVNAGDGVYQGIELSATRNLGANTRVRASWAVRSAFLTAIPSYIQDGTLVTNEQSPGLPLHKASVSIQNAPPRGFTYGATFVYESLYNELNQPAYGTIDAHLGYRFNGIEIGLTGTNLTNAYDDKFTNPGNGVAYGGVGQWVPQDAYALTGRAFMVTVLRRF